jgi:DNA-binding CsgD family transcriptional regulator
MDGTGGDAVPIEDQKLKPVMERLGVPAYALDVRGMIRWLNQAAIALIGDIRGRPFTNVIAPQDVSRLRQQFARKLSEGGSSNFDATLITRQGRIAHIGATSTALTRGGQVVGLFGVMTRPAVEHEPPVGAERLTPRQLEVLQLLARGSTTDGIAAHLHLSRETVRNHVRALLERLGATTRLEAVAFARRDGLVLDEPARARRLE